MKREELEALGMSKEQVDKVLDMHHAEYDPVRRELDTAKADLETEKKTTATQNTTIQDLKKDMEVFKDADVSGMREKIKTLETTIETQRTEHQQQLADRDFDDMTKEAIAKANGKNAKAIMALLDVDVLKASKNQRADVEAAIKALTEAEDSKMLFGEPEPNPVGTGNLIGQVRKPGASTEDAALRAAMGLPPEKE